MIDKTVTRFSLFLRLQISWLFLASWFYLWLKNVHIPWHSRLSYFSRPPSRQISYLLLTISWISLTPELDFHIFFKCFINALASVKLWISITLNSNVRRRRPEGIWALSNSFQMVGGGVERKNDDNRKVQIVFEKRWAKRIEGEKPKDVPEPIGKPRIRVVITMYARNSNSVQGRGPLTNSVDKNSRYRAGTILPRILISYPSQSCGVLCGESIDLPFKLIEKDRLSGYTLIIDSSPYFIWKNVDVWFTLHH